METSGGVIPTGGCASIHLEIETHNIEKLGALFARILATASDGWGCAVTRSHFHVSPFVDAIDYDDDYDDDGTDAIIVPFDAAARGRHPSNYHATLAAVDPTIDA